MKVGDRVQVIADDEGIGVGCVGIVIDTDDNGPVLCVASDTPMRNGRRSWPTRWYQQSELRLVTDGLKELKKVYDRCSSKM